MRVVLGTNDGNRQFIFDWMNDHMPGVGWQTGMPADFRGVIHFDTDTNAILAVVAFTGWTGTSALMHIASDGSHRWFSRDFIYECYRYAFEMSGLTRLNGLAFFDNPDAIRLHQKLGHSLDGTLWHEGGRGKHAYLYGATAEWWTTSKWNKRATAS